jgi:ABC-type transport system involved in multi-copper enzyme maturation permease subunit
MLARIWAIAANTFLEAVRQKFFNSLLLLAVALIASTHFFQQFDFGTSELKFIADFGFGALFVFGAVLAVFSTAQLFFNELENRTAQTLLAKPLHRMEFLVGKWLGGQLVLLAFVLALSLVLAGILWWREGALMAQLSVEGEGAASLIRYGDVFLYSFLQWVKFGVVSAITLFIGSFSNTNLYTIIVAFFVLVVCQLQYIAREAYAETAEGLTRWLVALVAWVFPNFQLFNVGDQMVLLSNAGLPLDTTIRIVGYGLFYMAVFLSLALLHFRRRQF